MLGHKWFMILSSIRAVVDLRLRCDLCGMVRLPFPWSQNRDALIECCLCVLGEVVLLRETSNLLLHCD